MGAARNIMEHKSAVINGEFLNGVSGTTYALGQTFVASSVELSDALSAVEYTADNLNKRAVEKFKLEK